MLPACQAVDPEGDELACEPVDCDVCRGPACEAHDECGGCRLVICPRCDTEGGMPVTAFAGDRVPHPHNERGT